MVEFNPTDQSQREREIRDIVNLPISGKVTKVYQHSEGDDGETIRVDVNGEDGEEYQKVPWMTPSRNVVTLPQKGDQTLLVFLQGVGKEARAIGNVHTVQNDPPLSREGDWRVRKGNAVIESRLIQGPSGDDSPSAEWSEGADMPDGGRSDTA